MTAAAPETQPRAALTAFALVAVAALLMSTKGILAKFMYAAGIGVEELLFLRSSIALPLFWAFAVWKLGLIGTLRIDRGPLLVCLGVGFLTYCGGAIADFEALRRIDAGLERILVYSFPAMVVLADAVRRRRIPPGSQILALVLTYGGIFLAMGGFDADLLRENLLGAALAIVAAITFAAYMMVNQQASRNTGSVRFTTYAMTGAAAGLTVYFLTAAPPGVLSFGLDGWAMLAVMAVFITVLPFFLLAEGIHRIGAPRAALIYTVGPPVTLVLAHFTLGEVMMWVQLVGAGLVLAGVLAIELRGRDGPRPASADAAD